MPKPTSLLLVSIDTLRADHLGCYGSRAAKTPRIDALARDGILFENASATAPITAPSHATLFTGLYPPLHGVRSNGLFRLPEDRTTIAERMRAAGFATAAVIGGFPLDARFGFAQGFDAYDDRLHAAGEEGEAERPAESVADAAIAAIDGFSRGKPFFLFLHFYDPHADYTPPADLAALAPYDGEIAYVDRELGRVLDALARRHLDDETAIALVSDHGESLGEHGEPTHSVFVYEATLHVALILKLPGKAPHELRLDSPVTLADVAPTLCDLYGLPPLPKASGVSLLPLISGKRSEPRTIYFESKLPEVEFGWSWLRGVRRGSVKAIDAPRREVYRLDSDPTENRNLYRADDPEAAALFGELARIEGSFPREEDDEAKRSVDAEELRKLEALGYVGGGSSAASGPRPDPKDRIGILVKMVEGLKEFKAGRFDRAEAAYREALADDPGNPVLQKNLGRSLGEGGKLAEADVALASALRAATKPLAADILDVKADFLMRRGDKGAARDARAALSLDPGSGHAAITLASALEAQGQIDDARRTLRGAAEKNPLKAGPLVALAEIEIRAGAVEDGRKLLEDALAREPEHGRAHFDLGQLLLREGKADEALAHLHHARSALPREGEVARQLAQALVAAGLSAEAEDALREQIALSPDDADSRYALAIILSRSGQLDAAIPMLKEMADREPQVARIWNALGTAYARRSMYEDAVPCFQRALAIEPSSADYRANLHQALAASKRTLTRPRNGF